VTRAWLRAVLGTSYVPMTRSAVQEYLHGLAHRLMAAALAEPFTPSPGYQVGVDLVSAHLAAPEALGRTIEVLNDRLLVELNLDGAVARERVSGLLGALASGYARSLRDRTLDEQESIRRAALVAREEAEHALRESEARFRHQALHDPLTGLPNRTLFAERLAQVFAAADAGTRVGACFIDLDGFKIVNDSLGHEVGDQLLVAVARRLDRWMSESGHLVARLGGDEFVILVERSTGTEEVVEAADTALSAIGTPVRIGDHRLSVSASAGVVERLAAETDQADLMRSADITLYWAKSEGKGRLALFDPDRNRREVARYGLAASLPVALDREEFALDYQPLVGLADGAVLGVEALVRWRHPTLGTLLPDRFIPLAEETGLVVPLGRRVLELACLEARRWQAESPGTPFVSVNLAVQQTRYAGLVDDVTRILDTTGLAPRGLQLEITESAVMGTEDGALHALRTLAGMGVRIAIDDFGTGYSNLAYLRTLPVCALKLDGAFVEGLRSPCAPDPTDEHILAALVSLAHALDLSVTAEGVETAAQAERLRTIGCDAGQGWFFGRPEPAERLLPLSAPPSGLTP
jgi:diguanylate cyclase (GGDEF)-like protein